MALSRKKNPYKTIYKKSPSDAPKDRIGAGIVIFWALFFIFISGLFILNWPRIRATMENALWPAWFKSRTEQKNPGTAPSVSNVPQMGDSFDIYSPVQEPVQPRDLKQNRTLPGGGVRNEPDPSVLPRQDYEPPAQTNPVPAPMVLPESSLGSSGQPPPEVSSRLSNQPSSVPSDKSSRLTPAPVLRDKPLYFIHVDRGGTILQLKVNRAIPSSDTPLLDVLQALLQGPTLEEQRQGFMSLIPQGTKILSLTIRKGTAYINISEDFQYNTFGVEGYAAQLNQIIWTVTEFPNVDDVQILIEGRRVDYLGEGIWIGSPINRDRF